MFVTGSIHYTTSADSNSYYVSTVGNDAWNGLYPTFQGGSNGPWATLGYAMTKTVAGDTVYVLAGTYTGTKIVDYSNVGAAGAWITYRAYGDGEVILDGAGTGYDGWTGVMYLYNQKYVRISGFTIRNSPNFGIYIAVQTNTLNTHNVTIDNCTLDNITSGGIVVYGSGANYPIRDVLIENNVLSDCQNAHSGARSQEGITICACERVVCRNNYLYDQATNAGIDVKGSSRYVEVYNNRVNTTNGDYLYGIYVDNNIHNVSFFNNVVWGSSVGFAIACENGGNLKDIFYYNNIFNGTGTGFKFETYAGYGGQIMENINIINNVACGASYGIRAFVYDHRCINWTIRNNIFDCTKGLDRAAYNISFSKHNVDHNLYDVTSSDYYGAYSINASPKFVNPTNGNFRLQPDSLAIDTGSPLYAPTPDFDGTPRPQGTGYDRGAYEYISFYDTTPPQIFDVSITTSGPLDTGLNYGWENISCTVTDNIAIDIVYIGIVHPTNNEINIEMTKISSSNYYYYNSSWSDYGNYSYYIWAIDTSDNTKQSENFYFLLAPNWDINNDGICNVLDLILVSNQYDEIGSHGWIREDVDNNGIVNVLDMSLVSDHYGEIWYT